MCSFCVMDFDTKSNLRDHVSSEHKRDILQNCPFCDKTFPTSKALRKHIKYARSGHRGLKNVKAHKCSFCDETFSTSDDLVLHTSSFHVCLYCSASFVQKDGLKDHVQSAHGQNHESMNLGGKLSSKQSTKDQGIRCDICNKKFSCQESLKDHAYLLNHW